MKKIIAVTGIMTLVVFTAHAGFLSDLSDLADGLSNTTKAVIGVKDSFTTDSTNNGNNESVKSQNKGKNEDTYTVTELDKKYSSSHELILQMLEDYNTNSINAAEKYSNKEVTLTLKFGNVTNGDYVSCVSDGVTTIIVSFSCNNRNVLKRLISGQYITVKGIFEAPTHSNSILDLKNVVIISAENIDNAALTDKTELTQDQKKAIESFNILKNINADYESNSLAAVEKWKNKKVAITFIFYNASSNDTDIFVQGDARNAKESINISADFPFSCSTALQKYKQGQYITVEGTLEEPTPEHSDSYPFNVRFGVKIKNPKIIN